MRDGRADRRLTDTNSRGKIIVIKAIGELRGIPNDRAEEPLTGRKTLMRRSEPSVGSGQRASTAARPASILVLDDDDGVRLTIATALAEAGYRVAETGDSMQALSLLEGSAHFDVLITDVVMPPGRPHGIAVGSMAALRRPGHQGHLHKRICRPRKRVGHQRRRSSDFAEAGADR